MVDVADQPGPTEGDGATGPPGTDDAASRKSSGGGDEQPKDQQFRNMTPDRLRLRNAHRDEFVFAPLEEKKLSGEWPVQELCDRELLGKEDPQKEKSIEWLVAPALSFGFLAFVAASVIAGDYPDHKALVWVIAITL